MFALPEIIFRKRIPPEYEGWVNAISLGLAMSGLASYVAEVPIIFQYDFAWLAAWGIMAVGTLIGLFHNNCQMRKLSRIDETT